MVVGAIIRATSTNGRPRRPDVQGANDGLRTGKRKEHGEQKGEKTVSKS